MLYKAIGELSLGKIYSWRYLILKMSNRFGPKKPVFKELLKN